MKKFNLLSIVLGSIVAIGSILLIENLFCMFYFYPGAELILNPELFTRSIATLSVGFYLPVICLNMAACFIAGIFPVIIGDEQLKHSVIVGVITALFFLLNCYYIPFPAWYNIISVLTIIPASFLGGFLLKNMFMRFPIGIIFYGDS